MQSRNWPDHEKLLWIMTSIHDWNKTSEEVLDRAIELWFVSEDFTNAVADGTDEESPLAFMLTRKD
jgi:hypothetical protein